MNSAGVSKNSLEGEFDNDGSREKCTSQNKGDEIMVAQLFSLTTLKPRAIVVLDKTHEAIYIVLLVDHYLFHCHDTLTLEKISIFHSASLYSCIGL